MADGKIYIIVTDRLPGGMSPIPDDNSSNQEKDKKDPFGDFAKHKFFNLIESQAKQAIHYSINNIGNFTGDYVTQQHMQDTVSIIESLTDVGMAALAGSKYSVKGAIVAASVAIISKGITYSQQLAAGYAQNELQNRQIDQLRTRAGLNSVNNNSRGTEY